LADAHGVVGGPLPGEHALPGASDGFE
jgi:hypothetical protein